MPTTVTHSMVQIPVCWSHKYVTNPTHRLHVASVPLAPSMLHILITKTDHQFNT